MDNPPKKIKQYFFGAPYWAVEKTEILKVDPCSGQDDIEINRLVPDTYPDTFGLFNLRSSYIRSIPFNLIPITFQPKLSKKWNYGIVGVEMLFGWGSIFKFNNSETTYKFTKILNPENGYDNIIGFVRRDGVVLTQSEIDSLQGAKRIIKLNAHGL